MYRRAGTERLIGWALHRGHVKDINTVSTVFKDFNQMKQFKK